MNVQLNNISCINQLTGAAHTGLTVSQRNSGSKYPMYDRQPRIALQASYSGDNVPSHGMKFIMIQPDDMVLGKMHQQIVLNWLRGQHKPTLVAEGWTVAAVKKVCAHKVYTSEELLQYMQEMNCFAHTMTLTSYFDEIVYAYAPAVGANDVHETVVDKVARLCLENDVRPGVRTRQALVSAPYNKRWNVIMRPDGEFEVAVKKKADEPEEKGIAAVDYAEGLLRRLEDEDEEALTGERIAAGLPRPDPAGERPVARADATPAHEATAGNPVAPAPWAGIPAILGRDVLTDPHVTHTPMIDALRAGTVNEFRGFDILGADNRPMTFDDLQRARRIMEGTELTAREIAATQALINDQLIIERATTDPVQAAQDAAITGTGVLLVPDPVPATPPPPTTPTVHFTEPQDPTTFDPIAT